MKACCQKYGFFILLVSLALNLFFVGSFIGQKLNTGSPPESFAPSSTLRGAIMQLSPEGRQAFGQAFLQNADLIMETKDEMASKRFAMLKKIGDPDLNIEELEALMTETAGLTNATVKGIHALFLQAISQLSDEDRQRLSEYMLEQREEGKAASKSFTSLLQRLGSN